MAMSPAGDAKAYSFTRLVADNLWLKRTRSLLAMLGVAVALGGAITMVGISESIEASLDDAYAARGVDLVVMQADKTNPMTSRLGTELLPALNAREEVVGVQALLVDSVSLNERHSILTYGWPRDYPELRKRSGSTGEPLEPGEVLVGRTAAALTGLEAGDRIDINLTRFRVAGLFEAESFFESGVIFMRLDDLQALVGAQGMVTFFLLDLVEGATAQQARAVAEQIESGQRGVRVLLADEFLSEDRIGQTVRGLGQVIFATSTILAILIISMVMVLTVSERYRELAILGAIGWSGRRIAALIVAETSILGICGAAVGVGVGWFGLGQALAHMHSLGVYAQSTLSATMLFWVAMVGVVVSVLGAAIPVYLARRIRIADALRQR